MSDLTLTTPEGRALDVTVETAGEASDPITTIVLTTAKGGTIRFEYALSDGYAIQEVVDNMSEILHELNGRLMQAIIERLQGGDAA